MLDRNSIWICVLIIMCSCTRVSDNQPSLSDSSSVVPGLVHPIISPNGEMALSINQKTGNIELFDLQTHKVVRSISTPNRGNGYAWSKNGEAVIYSEIPIGGFRSQAKLKSFEVATSRSSDINDIELNALQSFASSDPGDTLIYIDQNTLKLMGRTWDGTDRWLITSEDGQFYKPLISPNRQLVVVHAGSTVNLYGINGEFIRTLGRGIVTCWTPDSKYCLGFLDITKDGKTVSNSELLLFDIREEVPTYLTQTEDIIEANPTVSGTGVVLYTDLRTGTTLKTDLNLN